MLLGEFPRLYVFKGADVNKRKEAGTARSFYHRLPGGNGLAKILSWCDGQNRYFGPYVGLPGPLSDIPDRNKVPAGMVYLVDEAAVSSRKMRLLALRADYSEAGGRIWYPSQHQTLFSNGGIDATPVATITVASNAGTYRIGTLPANLFTVDGMRLWGEVWVGRGATAVGTFTANFSFGGTVVSSVPTITAASTRTARLPFHILCRAAASQSVNPQTAEWAHAATGGAGGITNTTVDCTSAVHLDFTVSSGTNDDLVDIVGYWVNIG